MIRIGIDCRLGGLAHAGIGRYCEQLVYQLVTTQVSESPSITWVLFFYNQKQISDSSLFSQIANHNSVEIRFAPIKHYTVREQFILPRIFNSAKLDLLHVPHFNVPILYKKPFVVTIHDLLWHHYRGTGVTTLPKLLYWIKYMGYRVVTRFAIMRAKTIFVPAKTVKKDLLSHFSKKAESVVVTYEGVDRTSLVTKATTKEKVTKKKSNTNALQALPNTFLLFVGSLYPHKNISIVLQALQKKPDLSVCIVGSRDIFHEAVKKEIYLRNIQHQVHFLGFVSDADLSQLYKQAVALVQPSLSEGFGLTGIEAMSVGSLVLASNIPIFRELYGPDAFLFNPHQFEDLLSTIEKALSLTNQEKSKRIAASKIHTNQFSWKKMAKKTYTEYSKILKRL